MLHALTHEQRKLKFGAFKFYSDPRPTNPEHVRIIGAWAEAHIAEAHCPQLKALFGLSRVNIHHAALDPFLELWKAWEKYGHLHLIKTWNGSYVTRFKRQSGTVDERVAKCKKLGELSLSNHTWGTAFDINAHDYPLGKAISQADPFCQLFPIAEDLGWVRGADFKSRPDPMHLEYVG